MPYSRRTESQTRGDSPAWETGSGTVEYTHAIYASTVKPALNGPYIKQNLS
jgi:hypothetical protein